MQFAAVDFETATPSRASACSLGLCVIENGEVVGTHSWLIQPPGNVYHPFHTSLHGIGPADTLDAPPFRDVVTEAWRLIRDMPLVAHNASFDMSVLRAGLDGAGMEYPAADYYCTLLMSRAHWPDLPGYALPIVLARCGFSHNHHEAGADAGAAARVLLQMAQDTRAGSIEEAASLLGVRGGQLSRWGYSPCSGPGAKSVRRDFKLSSIEVDTNADPGHPFFDADVAFTGTLLSMTREEAMQRVAERGGRPKPTVSRMTEYLVVGSVEYRSFATGEPSRKVKTALELRAKGHPLVMLSEQEFLEHL